MFKRPSLFLPLRCCPLLLGALACGGKGDSGAAQPEPTPGGPTAGLTEAGRWALSYTAEPSPIPFNAPFSLRWSVEARGDAPEATALWVEPWMPAHGHGGTTTPTSAPVEGGFLTTDLMLHMPGEWELQLRVEGDGADDFLVLPYTCCAAY